MKVYRSGDPNQRKPVLQPLSSGGPKRYPVDAEARAKTDPGTKPLKTIPPPQPEVSRESSPAAERAWLPLDRLDPVLERISDTRRAARRSVQVPVWAAASLLLVVLGVTVAIGYSQFVNPSQESESDPETSVLQEEIDEETAEVFSLLEMDPLGDLDVPPVWHEPEPSGMSARQEFLANDGYNPESREVRYSAEEVERLQAELEAIQRNSALLRSLARQQSGDLSAAYSSLEATQEQKDGALEDLQGRIDELEGRIQTVDELARELRDMLGLPELQSGLGGPSGGAATNGDPWLALRADIVAIEQRAGELVYDLDEVNTEIQLRLAQVRQTGLPNGGSVEANLQFYDAMPVGTPVDGPVTSRFGLRSNPFGPGSDMHTGIDIAARTGTPVRATGAGTVRVASDQGGYGLLVIIDHGNGVSTWYGHNSRFHVSPGQWVNAGEVIAEVGSTGMSTGPHVHYEIRVNNVPQDPLSLMMMER